MVERIALAIDGLHASRIVDVGNGRNIRADLIA